MKIQSVQLSLIFNQLQTFLHKLQLHTWPSYVVKFHNEC